MPKGPLAAAPQTLMPPTPESSAEPPAGSVAPPQTPPQTSGQPPQATPPVPLPSASTQPATPPFAVAGGAAVLALRPPELSAFAGQEFRADLTADNVESFSDSVVTVAYDPKIVEFRRAMEGDLLKRDNGQGTITLSADPVAGRIQLQLRRQGAPVSGGGVLATLIFQAKASGASPIDIVQPSVTGASSKSIPVTVTRGQVRVR
jgi:hypothetical protein